MSSSSISSVMTAAGTHLIMLILDVFLALHLALVVLVVQKVEELSHAVVVVLVEMCERHHVVVDPRAQVLTQIGRQVAAIVIFVSARVGPLIGVIEQDLLTSRLVSIRVVSAFPKGKTSTLGINLAPSAVQEPRKMADYGSNLTPTCGRTLKVLSPPRLASQLNTSCQAFSVIWTAPVLAMTKTIVFTIADQ